MTLVTSTEMLIAISAGVINALDYLVEEETYSKGTVSPFTITF